MQRNIGWHNQPDHIEDLKKNVTQANVIIDVTIQLYWSYVKSVNSVQSTFLTIIGNFSEHPYLINCLSVTEMDPTQQIIVYNENEKTSLFLNVRHFGLKGFHATFVEHFRLTNTKDFTKTSVRIKMENFFIQSFSPFCHKTFQ